MDQTATEGEPWMADRLPQYLQSPESRPSAVATLRRIWAGDCSPETLADAPGLCDVRAAELLWHICLDPRPHPSVKGAMLREVWPAGAFGLAGTLRPASATREIIEAVPPESFMTQEEQARLASLPDPVEAFRGWTPSSPLLARRRRRAPPLRPLQSTRLAASGFCWTLDLERARWFARRFSGEGGGTVVRALFPRDAIYAYTDVREESELIVLNWRRGRKLAIVEP